jgi:uncharacterized paraquat-inducible protein A
MRINSEQWDAMRYYYAESIHRTGSHLDLLSWIHEECKSEGMTREEFASHCAECLRIEREDAEGTCPKCGAYFDLSDESWEIHSAGDMVHYCGATS